ncbi:MAG: hypothetical protein ABJ308_13860 [Halieaceae bacterium]
MSGSLFVIAVSFAGFIVMSAVFAGLYVPLFRKAGVSEDLFPRSIKVGSLGAGVQVGSALLVALSSGVTLVSIVSVPGAILAALIVGRFLRGVLSLPTWKIYSMSFGVTFAGSFVLAIIMFTILDAT